MKQRVEHIVRGHEASLISVSHDLHAHPEVAWEEVRSSALVANELSGYGYDVVPVEGLPTAFVATAGSGPLHVGICAEYDALPGVGHACGHNVIAAAAVGAAAALAPLVDDLGLRVSVFGTPAEEDGGGKIAMIRKGIFDGVDAAMMVHPHAIERVAMRTLAISEYDVVFNDRPTRGGGPRSAQRRDSAPAAMSLFQAGIGMAREHFLASDRVHGIVNGEPGTTGAGTTLNRTSGRWYVRSATVEQLDDLEQRIDRIVQGAARMSGCEGSMIRTSDPYADLRSDPSLVRWWRENAAAVGRRSLTVQPDDPCASTDMGNVSHVVPSIHPLLDIGSNGVGIHESAFAGCSIAPGADAAIVDGAITMARTAIDLAVAGFPGARTTER